MPYPMFITDPLNPPMLYHACLGESESDKHVDAIKDYKHFNRAPCQQKDNKCSYTHEKNTILDHKPVTEHCKAPGKPTVTGHIGHNTGTVKETRLGCDEKECSLCDQGDK